MNAYRRTLDWGRRLAAHRRLLPAAIIAGPILALLFSAPFRLWTGGWLLTAVSTTLFLTALWLRAMAAAVALEYRGRGGEGEPSMTDMVAAGGIYSVMRFPVSASNVLVIISLAVYTGAVWYVAVSALASLAAAWCIVLAEEHSLEERYGDDFEAWCGRTCALFPFRASWQPWRIRVDLVRAFASQASFAAVVAGGFCLTDLLKNWRTGFTVSLSFFWLALFIVFLAAAVFGRRDEKKAGTR